MSEPTKEQIEAFLSGLAELSERTGVVINGCWGSGCHCSMTLDTIDAETVRPVRYVEDRGTGPGLVTTWRKRP